MRRIHVQHSATCAVSDAIAAATTISPTSRRHHAATAAAGTGRDSHRSARGSKRTRPPIRGNESPLADAPKTTIAAKARKGPQRIPPEERDGDGELSAPQRDPAASRHTAATAARAPTAHQFSLPGRPPRPETQQRSPQSPAYDGNVDSYGGVRPPSPPKRPEYLHVPHLGYKLPFAVSPNEWGNPSAQNRCVCSPRHHRRWRRILVRLA